MKNIKLVNRGFDIEGDPINNSEVELCKAWIKNNMKPRKTINKRISPYNLKEKVEKHLSELKDKGEYSGSYYVSNGAFIKAAIDLGFKYKTNRDINPYFAFSFINKK